MKLTALLLTVAMLSAHAGSFSQSITLTGKNVPLKSIFTAIERQTSYVVFVNKNDLAITKPVSLSVKEMPLPEFMDMLLRDQPLEYVFSKKNIILSRKEAVIILPRVTPSSLVTQPPASVTGVIHNAVGEGLVGVTVRVKGTSNGTTTNSSGVFALSKLPENAVLQISYIGYQMVEVAIRRADDVYTAVAVNREHQRLLYVTPGNELTMNVKLPPAENTLDQVQIMAYGVTTQRFATGNISTVKAADIEKSNVTNPLLALQGRVPGIFISQASGMAGSGVSVRIQGRNSITAGNDPFYVVDGVPYPSQNLPSLNAIQGNSEGNLRSKFGDGNPLSFINPNDIESIDILKDADATAIYGSRAANGAVLITTKKGKSGKTNVSVRLNEGFGEVPRKVDMLKTPEYLDLRRAAYAADGLPLPVVPEFTNYDLTVFPQDRYVDYQELLLGGKARYSDVMASVSGGNQLTQVLLSLKYHKENNIFAQKFSDKVGSAHFSMNHQSANQRFKMGFAGSFLHDFNTLPNTDLTERSLNLAPNGPDKLYNEDGTLNWEQLPDGRATWYNPMAFLEDRYMIRTNNLVSSLDLKYEILKGLRISGAFGYTSLATNEKIFYPQSAVAPHVTWNARRARYSDKSANTWTVEPQLTYQLDKPFGRLDILIGSTFQQNHSDRVAFEASGFTNDKQLENIKAAPNVQIDDNVVNLYYKYNALFGRFNYNYKDKYILNLSARRDGSSRFGTENLFNNFYSAGGAWLFSNEDWMKEEMPFLSFGKLKISYGTTGSDQIGDYAFMSLYEPYTNDIPYGGGIGLRPTGHNNPYLQWEITRKFNTGIDLGFMDNRILLNMNVFRNRSSNQLVSDALPVITGFGSIDRNRDAKVQNSGVELMLNADIIKKKNFTWSASFNYTRMRNKLIEFEDFENSPYANDLFIGEPITIQRAYRYAGIDPDKGIYRFYAADGGYTFNPDWTTDKTERFTLDPNYFGGLQQTFSYRGFTLDMLLQFVKKKAITPELRFGAIWPGNYSNVNGNQPAYTASYWVKGKDDALIQKPTVENPEVFLQYYTVTNSDAAIVDASFIRLKNVSLSYTFPQSWTSKANIDRLQLFMQGQNLLTFTKYKGLDPESANWSTLPPLRVLTFGIQMNL